jgi:hypothetical protein
MKIYDVYMTPDGRVDEDQAMTNALEGARSILRQSDKTKNGLSQPIRPLSVLVLVNFD